MNLSQLNPQVLRMLREEIQKALEAVSETAQKLKAALELLGPNGENWGKGADIPMRRRKRCLILACGDAGLSDFHGVFRNVLNVQSLVDWNDDPERTFADVKAVFEKAIEANL